MDQSEEKKKATDTEVNNESNAVAQGFASEDLLKFDSKIFSQITQTLSNTDLGKSFSKAAVDLAAGVIDFSPTKGKPSGDADKSAKSGQSDAKTDVKADAKTGAKSDTSNSESKAESRESAKEAAKGERISRSGLEMMAEKYLKDDAQRTTFLGNVEAFESRAAKDKLPQDQKERFYAQVSDVLDASKSGNKNFDSAYLRTIASDMMKEAATPGSVNQGSYGTCTAAALQSALFKAEPATVGGLVRDLALNGEYKTVDGSIIKPNEKNLKPDKYHTEESLYSRNSVDQLAQIGLLNVFWQRQAGLDGDNKTLVGKIKYEEGHVRDNLSDDRTRLMDYSQGTPKPITEQVAVNDPGLKIDTSAFGGVSESRPISGPRILDMANINDMYNQLKGNKGNLKVISGGGSDPVFKPKSEEELKDFIEKARKDNNGVLPAMVLGVHTNVEPFKSDLKDAFYSKKKSENSGVDPEDIHGHHAVALFDFDTKSNKTILENQWGHNVDHTGEKGSKPLVDLKDIFKAVKGEDRSTPKEESKPASPERVDPEKNAKEYIDGYKKFVKELEGDADANSASVLHHQMKLNNYFKTWDRNNESKEQLEKIGAQLTKSLSDMSLKDATAVYSSLAKDFKAVGMDGKISELNNVLEHKLNSELKELGAKSTDFRKQREIMDTAESVLKSFKEAGDSKAIERTVNLLVSRADAKRKESGVSDQKSIDLTIAVSETLLKSGNERAVETLVNNTLSAIKEAEAAANGDKSVAAKAKIAIAQISKEIGKAELSKSIYGELEATYNELKDKDAPSGSKTTRSELLHALKYHYSEEKNGGDKLEALVGDWVKDIKGMIAVDSGTEERKNDWRSNMLESAGETLERAKRPEQALKYYKEGIESARKLADEDKAQRLAQKAMSCCKRLGRTEEAEALSKEFKLRNW